MSKFEKFALISVFDKTGIVKLASNLISSGYQIISTGGTAKVLTQNKIKVIPIAEITGNPESFDGRIKTISFQIESGILFDRTKSSHINEAKKFGIKPIDLVVCNLYPFEQTIKDPKTPLEEAVENIDVGGPTMIRAAAKNFKNVVVITDPSDYQNIIELLKNRKFDEKTRKGLAAKAFAHLSFYDSQISHYLEENLFPNEITLPGRKFMDLRYGENPHQKAAVYFWPNTNSPFKELKHHWGRGSSWMNIVDINAGIEIVGMFEEPAAVVIKHNSPCGIALGKTAKEALKNAIEGDPESAFGGIVVANKPMDLKTAKIIGGFKEKTKGNMDIIAVPSIDEKTLEYLKLLRKSMGIYTFGSCHPEFISGSKLNGIPKQDGYQTVTRQVRNDNYSLKWIKGGFILQTPDDNIEKSFKEWKIVTDLKPTKKQMEQMRIGWKFISRVKSNSIIIVDKNLPMTRGIGSGQTSRLRSSQIALKQAEKFINGSILVSDSFFPFDDTVRLAGKLGIGAIVQQGGSINDKASIDAANELKIPMVFTGRRAFWH